MINYLDLHNNRREFLKNFCNEDHVVEKGENCVLISAPHGVSQFRINRTKVCEPGSLTTALFLHNENKTFFIAKTKNNNDDANFDEVSPYKTEIKNLINNYNIKYVLDFHSLSKTQKVDIDLGTDNYNNTKLNNKALQNLISMLEKNNFKVGIDVPFVGGERTVSGFVQTLNKPVFSLQVEINSAITNHAENEQKYHTLLNIFSDWIKTLK